MRRKRGGGVAAILSLRVMSHGGTCMFGNYWPVLQMVSAPAHRSYLFDTIDHLPRRQLVVCSGLNEGGAQSCSPGVVSGACTRRVFSPGVCRRLWIRSDQGDM
jgi:hypothetical protein